MQTQSTMDVSTWNKFVDIAQSFGCDAECERQKTIDDLKSEYQSAKENAAMAQPKLSMAKKNLLVYTEGEQGYQAYQQKMYTKEANEMRSQLTTKLDHLEKNISREIQSYVNVRNGVAHSIELLRLVRLERANLERIWKTSFKTVAVNDRKTYYEDQQNRRLDTVYRWIWMAYNTALVGMVCMFIYYYASMSWKKMFVAVIVAVVAAIYPFISTPLFLVLLSVVYWIVGFVPKNVYINY